MFSVKSFTFILKMLIPTDIRKDWSKESTSRINTVYTDPGGTEPEHLHAPLSLRLRQEGMTGLWRLTWRRVSILRLNFEIFLFLVSEERAVPSIRTASIYCFHPLPSPSCTCSLSVASFSFFLCSHREAVAGGGCGLDGFPALRPPSVSRKLVP